MAKLYNFLNFRHKDIVFSQNFKIFFSQLKQDLLLRAVALVLNVFSFSSFAKLLSIKILF